MAADAGTYTVRGRVKTARSKFRPVSYPANVYYIGPYKAKRVYLPLGAEEVAESTEDRPSRCPYADARSGPRRGMIDAEERLWFAKPRDGIGMFYTKTRQFKEAASHQAALLCHR